jgi:hypothetical protein
MEATDQAALAAGAASIFQALAALVVLILFGLIFRALLTAPALAAAGVEDLTFTDLQVAPALVVVAHWAKALLLSPTRHLRL